MLLVNFRSPMNNFSCLSFLQSIVLPHFLMKGLETRRLHIRRNLSADPSFLIITAIHGSQFVHFSKQWHLSISAFDGRCTLLIDKRYAEYFK